MPDFKTIEIKGLAAAVQAARDGMSTVRRSTAELHESAASFAATAAEVKRQIDAAHDDLKFEASNLGNGGPSPSGTSA